jgi:hypothetical protein
MKQPVANTRKRCKPDHQRGRNSSHQIAIISIATNAYSTWGALKSKCNTAVVYGMVFAESSSLANQAL